MATTTLERSKPKRMSDNILLISADNHVNEPPGVYIDRVPAQLKDRAPRVMDGADGGEGWSFDGKQPKRTFGIEAFAGLPKEKQFLSGRRFADLLPGNWDGAAHLKEMDLDGVYGVVCYPGSAIALYLMPDKELSLACFRAYNDWMIDDFQGADKKRLVGLPLIPVDHGIDVAVAEMKRTAKKGVRGFFLPALPEIPYNHPTHYEDLWRTATDLDIAVTIHRNHGGKPDKSDWDEMVDQRVQPSGIVVRFFSAVRPLTYMIFSGVFERHPKLRFLAAEVDCGWVPFWVQTMVNHWERQSNWAPQTLKRSPEACVGENVFTTNIDDFVGYDLVKSGKYPYLANMAMFSSDYPHSATIWPHSADVAEKMCAGMALADKKKLLSGNAARVFHFDI